MFFDADINSAAYMTYLRLSTLASYTAKKL